MTIIAILPGPKRGEVNDPVVLIGAHYDTLPGSAGVDDDGSGAAGVIEAARILTARRDQLNVTVIFGIFDFETLMVGSQRFISNYLMINEILGYKINFIGAYILDMILRYDNSENSQILIPKELTVRFVNIYYLRLSTSN